MAEYIDREKLIERLHNAEENYKADHDYEVDDDPFSDGILSAMFCVNQIIGIEPIADVIKRSKYEKLRLVNLDLAETNKGLLAEHEQLEKLRSKIDKAIAEMKKLSQAGDYGYGVRDCIDRLNKYVGSED